ncbi:hypothetical protein SLEP1_g48743 [Rubroshorea leprosula]|uniref:Uncharacterized protein n=1 Tax=Rubroshorea leprosula TaxID=152421 RepID=A0AAV5LVE4_9ROSI|nr:hypothetical protein SLEP1_g48743 [Rubroshorea leprosula]
MHFPSFKAKFIPLKDHNPQVESISKSFSMVFDKDFESKNFFILVS